MNNLPYNWTQANVASLIVPDGLFADGNWIESKDQDPLGSIRLVQLADVGDGEFLNRSKRFVSKAKFEMYNWKEVVKGDVLVARMPEPLGRACLMPKLKQKSITVVDIAILRPGRNSVFPSWLMFF